MIQAKRIIANYAQEVDSGHNFCLEHWFDCELLQAYWLSESLLPLRDNYKGPVPLST